MAPTSDNGSRDAGETRTMQEGSMKFVVAAVGSDSEETAALLELLAGERLGFDRPQGEVDEDRPALLRHAPDSPRGYLSCVLASDANLEPALEALREARVVLWLHRARVFDVELLVRFRRLREARDALADAALDPPVLVVVGVAPRSNAHGDPSERDGTDDEVRELLRPHASVPGDGVAAADDTPLFRLLPPAEGVAHVVAQPPRAMLPAFAAAFGDDAFRTAAMQSIDALRRIVDVVEAKEHAKAKDGNRNRGEGHRGRGGGGGRGEGRGGRGEGRGGRGEGRGGRGEGRGGRGEGRGGRSVDRGLGEGRGMGGRGGEGRGGDSRGGRGRVRSGARGGGRSGAGRGMAHER